MEFISENKTGILRPLIWVFIYLSIVPVQMSNYVLCIGSDGHVQFESGIDGRCTDTHDLHEASSEISITAAVNEADHCGSCLDIPLFAAIDSEPYLVPAVQDALRHLSASTTPLITHSPHESTLLTLTALPDTPSVIDPTLVSLRTTTLLI